MFSEIQNKNSTNTNKSKAVYQQPVLMHNINWQQNLAAVVIDTKNENVPHM